MSFDPDRPMTVGVEEELLLIDADSGELVPRARDVMPRVHGTNGSHTQNELNLCQVEIDTPVCTSLDEVEEALHELRGSLADAAAELGYRVLPASTHPFSTWTDQQVDRDVARFDWMVDRYRLLAAEQVICGAHVHVGLGGGETDIRVMNRIRAWLPVLLALSANSPSWEGRDSGYASYRTEVWVRWPTAGFPPLLEDREEYDRTVTDLIGAGIVPDDSFLYWYLRPSSTHATMETRSLDTPLRVEDTVAIAGLVRALAWRYATEEPAVPLLRHQVLEAAMWQAARYGVDDELLHPGTGRPAHADEVVEALLDAARPGLEHHGDTERVAAAVKRILGQGNGATVQREVRDEGGDGPEVVHRLLEIGGTAR